jgi:peptidoglycan hydrolase CwlO-like protein
VDVRSVFSRLSLSDFGRKVESAAMMELSHGIEERVKENAFQLKFGLVVFSAVLIIGGSSILTTQPVGGGVLIFVGILLDLGVLRIYKLENKVILDEIETTQTEINRTKNEISSIRDEVNTTKEQADTTRTEISDSKDEIEDMQVSLRKIREIQRTK